MKKCLLKPVERISFRITRHAELCKGSRYHNQVDITSRQVELRRKRSEDSEIGIRPKFSYYNSYAMNQLSSDGMFVGAGLDVSNEVKDLVVKPVGSAKGVRFFILYRVRSMKDMISWKYLVILTN